MADFSATDAALEGFRLTRERPRAVILWAALILAASVVFTVLAVTVAGEALNTMMSGGLQGGDPDETLAAFRRIGPLYLLLLPLGALFYAALYGAVYRAILRPQDDATGYLRLGADELRLAGALVLLGLLFLGVALVFGLLLALVVGGLGVAGGTGGAVAGAVLLPLILVIGLLLLAVRFSLALPATFAEGKIRIFESWRLTKGRFWPLLGAYVLSIILSVVVYLLAMMIYFAVAALVAGGVTGAASVFSPDYGSLAEAFSVAMIIYLLVTAVVSAITTAITAAPPAAAYRDITGYGRNTAEVFS